MHHAPCTTPGAVQRVLRSCTQGGLFTSCAPVHQAFDMVLCSCTFSREMFAQSAMGDACMHACVCVCVCVCVCRCQGRPTRVYGIVYDKYTVRRGYLHSLGPIGQHWS